MTAQLLPDVVTPLLHDISSWPEERSSSIIVNKPLVAVHPEYTTHFTDLPVTVNLEQIHKIHNVFSLLKADKTFRELTSLES